MTTTIIRIELPPAGRLETSGNGSDPTAGDMTDEDARRDAFVAGLAPTVDAVLARPLRRSGNVSRVELLGAPTWSQLNHYLLLVEVDIGDPRLDPSAIAPPGSTVEVIGQYRSIRSWPGGDRIRSAHPVRTRPATRGFHTLEEIPMTAPTTGPSSPGTSGPIPIPPPPYRPWNGTSEWPAHWPPPWMTPWPPQWPTDWWGTDLTPPPATRGTRGVDGNGGPLSPDGFGEGAEPGPTTAVEPASASGVLTDADKATLRRVRQLVAEVRKALASADKDEVADATSRLDLVVGYLNGYLDGKGGTRPAGSPGLAAMFPAPKRSTDEHLDEIDAMLEKLTLPGTRGIFDFLGDWWAEIDISIERPSWW